MALLAAPDQRLRLRAALVSVITGVTLLVVKFAAFLLTHSTAVLSDALESIINVVASAFALFSVTLSGQPADRNHPYGHGKVEFFAAGLEGVLIFAAAIAIIWTAVPNLLHPPALGQLELGLVLLVIGGVVNYLLGVYLIRVGRSAKSDTLVADGHHVHTDAFTSLGVIVGLFLVRITGWLWLDPVVAILVAINILYTGFKLIRVAASGLMDESDTAFLERIAPALEQIRQPGWSAPHYLRSRRSGAVRHIDFHLILPRFWSLEESHAVHKLIEPALLEVVGERGEVIVHFDPCSALVCPRCDLPDCPVREAPLVPHAPWQTVDLLGGPPGRGNAPVAG
jgi:cation diffusion facilitator family transporter